ncbi:MAG: transposase [Longimicrobiales bacterium]
MHAAADTSRSSLATAMNAGGADASGRIWGGPYVYSKAMESGLGWSGGPMTRDVIILLRALRTTLRRASPSRSGRAQFGAVSFRHRFGSALNPHFHLHEVVLDGVFSEEPDGSVTYHEATHLSAHDAHRLQRTLQRRVLRLFLRRGLLDDATVANMLTLLCTGCGAPLHILAFLTAAEPVGAILRHLGLPTTPPPLSPGRAPPHYDFGFDADPGPDIDQTPSYDPTEPEPVPDVDFNQSHGA